MLLAAVIIYIAIGFAFGIAAMMFAAGQRTHSVSTLGKFIGIPLGLIACTSLWPVVIIAGVGYAMLTSENK